MCRAAEGKSSDLDRELQRLHAELDKKQEQIRKWLGDHSNEATDRLYDRLLVEEAGIKQAIERNEERLQGAWCLMLDLMRSFSFFGQLQPLLPSVCLFV